MAGKYESKRAALGLIYDLGFGVNMWVSGLGLRAQGLGFKVSGLSFRAWNLGFKV